MNNIEKNPSAEYSQLCRRYNVQYRCVLYNEGIKAYFKKKVTNDFIN